MQELKRLLGNEQQTFNAVLSRFIGEMPVSSRPVAEHILASGGKRLRPFLTLYTGRALGGEDEKLYTLGAAVEMLHAATLLHDDILDNATLRRGKPAAHTIFSQLQAILAGDAMLAKAMLIVSRLGDTRLTDCISEAVMRTAEGEIQEFTQLRDSRLSHEDYITMITGKTAWMLRASCELGALAAKTDPELAQAAASFGLELGIAFQMVDDALDFSPSSQTGKPTGGDIREGKITPPLTYYLQNSSPEEASRLREAIANNSLKEDEIEALCARVFQQGYAGKTRENANRHLETAAASLKLFPESPYRTILEKMLAYIQTRDH
jgi:Geranylgeranyl pyrophosphate synthase